MNHLIATDESSGIRRKEEKVKEYSLRKEKISAFSLETISP